MSIEESTYKKKSLKDICVFILELCFVFLLCYSIPTFIVQRTYVFGGSMENTYYDGQDVVCNKIIYKIKDPERFDVITFKTKENEIYIKRIIGLPNETIQIDENGHIFINGELLSEDFGKEVIQDAGLAIDKIQLKDNEYFVLGDNRNNSIDSRFETVGNIKKLNIIGKIYSD